MSLRRILPFLLALAIIAHAQFYDVSIVRANDSNVSSLVYDINSTSYKDSSLANPAMMLRICTASSSDLLHKYVALAYADGFDGKYIVLEDAPIQVQNVTPSGCALVPAEISSFKAWYPSIPYVFIANNPSLSGASRWKLSRLRGWMEGDYGVNLSLAGNSVNVTVVNDTDENGTDIVPDVDYLVVGLMRPDFTTMDTAISAPNQTDTLNSDGGAYHVLVNGIGPAFPPYVKILTPQPTIYDTTQLPFTYIMLADNDINNCWYVLDGHQVGMPDCTIAYILNVQNGTHVLVLYGNDTNGTIASDQVVFTVNYKKPELPGTPGAPVNGQVTPVVPPGPPSPYFSIEPPDITVVMDYPNDGVSNFSLVSNVEVDDVQCFVRGDFENYTTVTLDSGSVPANGSISGTITVSMGPDETLDYNGGLSGSLQCVGNTAPSLTSSTMANVYLIINKPVLQIQNATISGQAGNFLNASSFITNVGSGNSTFVNITAVVVNYPGLVSVEYLPQTLPNGQTDSARFVLNVAPGMEPGVYDVQVDFYENGRAMGSGYIVLTVLAPNSKPTELISCTMSDPAWTLLILLLGVIVSMIVFTKVHDQQQENAEKPRKWKRGDKDD